MEDEEDEGEGAARASNGLGATTGTAGVDVEDGVTTETAAGCPRRAIALFTNAWPSMFTEAAKASRQSIWERE